MNGEEKLVKAFQTEILGNRELFKDFLIFIGSS